MSPAHRIVPAVLFAAVALSACSHHPTVAPAPVSVAPQVPDSSAIFAARRAHEDSLRAAAELAARQAQADSARMAQEQMARLQDLEQTLTAPLYFDFDKSTLRPVSVTALDAKTPIMQNSPTLRIRIEGNADERGSDEYNLALGMRRASAAKHFLAEHGVDSTTIDVVSYGKERPVCTEHNETCWQQNRRDGFTIVNGKPRLVGSTT